MSGPIQTDRPTSQERGKAFFIGVQLATLAGVLVSLAFGADWHGVALVLSSDMLVLSVSCFMVTRR